MTANDGVQDCALMGMTIQSDGGGYQYLNASFANFEGIKPLSDEKIASSPSRYNNIYMNGSEVYKWAVRGVPQVFSHVNARNTCVCFRALMLH